MAFTRVHNVREKVDGVEEIATLPSSLERILTLVQDESSTALDLAAAITTDQALAMTVLRTVNSSFYSFQRRIQTIHEAVVILGFCEVERLALAASVINLFGKDRQNASFLRVLWRHSMAVSVVAGTFETHCRTVAPRLAGAHVAGLLHDVGKAVIAQLFPEAVQAILRVMSDTGLPSYEAEREVLDGANHCDVGSWLAERWNLPPALVDSIAHHHAPDTVSADQLLVHATHLADWMCTDLNVASVCAPNHIEEDPAAAQILGASPALFERVNMELEKHHGPMAAVATAAGYGASDGLKQGRTDTHASARTA